MRSFLRSLLAFLTLGMCSAACTTRPDATPEKTAVTDVTLVVPGMH